MSGCAFKPRSIEQACVGILQLSEMEQEIDPAPPLDWRDRPVKHRR